MTIQPHPTRAPVAIAVCAIMLGAIAVCAAGCTDDAGDKAKPTAQDAMAMFRLVDDTKRLTKALSANEDFWARSKDDPLTTDERAWLMPLFARWIDYDLAFTSYGKLFMGASQGKPDKDKAYVLVVGVGAHTARLGARLQLISLVGNNGAIKAALNEGSPEHGLAAGHLDRIAIESARPDALMRLEIGLEALGRIKHHLGKATLDRKKLGKAWQAVGKYNRAKKQGKTIPAEVKEKFASVDLDSFFGGLLEVVEEAAVETGQRYMKVSGKLLKQTIATMLGNEVSGVVDPLVLDIALWLGDTRLRSSDRHLISEADLDALQPKLRPGDVIVERRNWYLSNLGLPGFWPHAALYLGSPAELAAHFDKDADVTKRFGGAFSAYLKKTYGDAWHAYEEDHGDGPMRVIEAISEGVVFTSLYHSCLADYVAFMRPRRTPVERAVAVAQAFSHWSKPYDFDFDFQTITTLVCSELVYSSWQLPSADGKGVKFNLEEVVGRMTLPPNSMVQQFDEEYGTAAQQLDFVAFLDGDEKTVSAKSVDVQAFRKSWLRPKWDLSAQ